MFQFMLSQTCYSIILCGNCTRRVLVIHEQEQQQNKYRVFNVILKKQYKIIFYPFQVSGYWRFFIIIFFLQINIFDKYCHLNLRSSVVRFDLLIKRQVRFVGEFSVVDVTQTSVGYSGVFYTIT